MINPILLVEVLSESTAAYDRGEKFRHYQSFATLREYLLIDQSATRVAHYSIADDGGGRSWRRRDHSNVGHVASLSSLGTALALADIYAGVAPASPPA